MSNDPPLRLAGSFAAAATRYRDGFRPPNFRRIAGLALGAALTGHAVRWLPGLPNWTDLATAAGGVPMSTFLAGFAWHLASAFFLLAIAAAMDTSGSSRSAAAALAIALRRTPAMLAVLVVVMATIVTGVLLAAGATVLLLVAAAPQLQPGALEAMIFGTLTLILALPLVTVLAYWYFAFFLVVTDRLPATAALGRSFALVRGRLLRVKLALSAVFLVSLLMLSSAEAAGAALGALLGLGGGWLAALAGVLGSAIAAPLIVAASLALLDDLKRRDRGSPGTSG